jgi:hypothetical protein
MNNMPNLQNATFEYVWAALLETREQIRKTGLQMEKSSVEFEKSRKDFDRRMEKSNAEYEKSQKDFDRRMKRSNAEYEKSQKDFDRRMKKLEEYTGGIANNNGEMAEEYFYNAFRRSKNFGNETFDKVLRNRCIKNGIWNAEFDLLLLNGKSAAIIEIKYRAKPENINIEKLISRIEPFKALFPDYKNHNIFLGVAAMSFNKILAKQLRKAGIATIHQEGKKMVLYDQELKAF